MQKYFSLPPFSPIDHYGFLSEENHQSDFFTADCWSPLIMTGDNPESITPTPKEQKLNCKGELLPVAGKALKEDTASKHVKPSTHTPWSKEESELLMKKFLDYGKCWTLYLKHFPGRTASALRNRWRSLNAIVQESDPFQVDKRLVNYSKRKFNDIVPVKEVGHVEKMKKSKRLKTNVKKLTGRCIVWSDKHDATLRCLVAKYGNTWIRIAKLISDSFQDFTPNSKQCRDRWNNHLKLRLNNEPWTEEESALLKKNYELYGDSWKSYKKAFPTRSPEALRTQWNALSKSDATRAVSSNEAADSQGEGADFLESPSEDINKENPDRAKILLKVFTDIKRQYDDILSLNDSISMTLPPLL